MSPYTTLASTVLFPLHERLKGHSTLALRRRLELSQWWSPERFEAERVARLREFLADIGRHVPHFRDLYARTGFDPRAVQSVADLLALPLHGKAEMRAAAARLTADDAGPLARGTTGGSSGEPLIFGIGKGRTSHDVAAKWRATRWWGVDIGDPELVVWGSAIELGAHDRLRRWRDRLLRSELLPAFEMSPDRLDGYLAHIRRVRPAMLFGYPSSLALIAAHAARRGVALNDLGTCVVFVTSERLYDEQRAAIAAAFGCPVANGYGARDAGFIAHECPAGSLHLSAEDLIVETLRPDGSACADGEAGEIVVTHLATRDYPFVRYRTGDVGAVSAFVGGSRCACGRGLPVLSQLDGRSSDFVVAADGTVMHGLALIYTLRDLPGIERFRIEQLSLAETEVRIVPGAGFDAAAAEARIRRDFQARLGAAVQVRVQVVDAIAPEASGKFRHVLSRVALPPSVSAHG